MGDWINDAYIPGLPDEVAIRCLLCVPRENQRKLSLVCRSWNKLVESSMYGTLRQMSGFSRPWLYILSRDGKQTLQLNALDPVTFKWHRKVDIPSKISCLFGVTCQVVDDKDLYIAGGTWWTGDCNRNIYRLNALTGTWTSLAPLSEGRCYAASGTIAGKLFVVGGVNCTSVEFYDKEKDRWYNASDLLAEIDFRDSVVYNGKLYVAGIQSPAVTSSLWSGQCYEAETDTWRFMKPTMVEGWKGPSVELDGKLFGVEWNQGIRISCYDDLSGRWKRLGRIPDNVLSPPLSLCGLLGKLYVVGRGGCMLEIKTKELGQRTSLNPMLARKIEGIGGKEYTVVGCYVVWA